MRHGFPRLLAAAFVPVCLSAQDVTGGLHGRLVTLDRRPVAAAQVTVTSPSMLGERRAESDADGVFRLLALPAGSYTVKIRSVGYRPLTIQDVRIDLGATTTIAEVLLDPQTVELSEIVVSGRTFGIDPASAALGANVQAADYAALPVGRDYRSIVEFLPQANTSYLGDAVNIGGATGSENAYFVDGINLTDAIQGGPGASMLPYNFVRAVEVNEGGYEARYGRAIGGTVNAVTYSGGNTFEGQVFGFFTGQALTASERVGLRDLPNSRFASYDAGARVSGAIVVDRLWFAAAYNPQVERVDRSVPGQGVFEDRLTRHLFGGKLTWRPHAATTVEAFLLGERTSHRAVSPPILLSFVPDSVANADPYLTDTRERRLAGSLRLAQQLGAAMLFEVVVSRSGSSRSLSGEGDSLFYQDALTQTISGGNQFLEEPHQVRTAVGARMTLIPRTHTLMLGAEYEDNEYRNRFRFAFITRTDTALWVESLQDAGGTVHNRMPTLYAQDSWSLTRRLTVNVGLRWAQERLYGTDGLAQSFRDEWQPRAGAVLQLGRLGTQRLTASWGIFYQQQPLNLSIANYIPYPFYVRYYSVDPRTGAAPDSVLDFTTYPSQFPNVPDLSVEHHREWTVGYERLLLSNLRVAARLVRRDLLSGFGTGFDYAADPIFVIGTPGKGALSFLPRPRREYTALEASMQWLGARGRRLRASYVLSRTFGNYPGLYISDNGIANQGILSWLGVDEQAPNSTGLLPNDRTHVLKLSGAYPVGSRVTVGAFGTWQSGVPLNEFGASALFPTFYLPTYVSPRGSRGRSPSLWDLSLRATYDVPAGRARALRVVLDWFHLFSPRRTVWLEQQHYLSQDANGNQTNPNPTYGQALRYQPPMQARLGMEMSF